MPSDPGSLCQSRRTWVRTGPALGRGCVDGVCSPHTRACAHTFTPGVPSAARPRCPPHSRFVTQAVFTLLLGPFTFFDVQKTKYLQILTSLMRWVGESEQLALSLPPLGPSFALRDSQERGAGFCGLPGARRRPCSACLPPGGEIQSRKVKSLHDHVVWAELEPGLGLRSRGPASFTRPRRSLPADLAWRLDTGRPGSGPCSLRA